MQNLFTGKLVRLVAFDPERAGELLAKWYRDSEFTRFYDTRPVMPRDENRAQAQERKHAEEGNLDLVQFLIETLAEQTIIGECELERNASPLHEAFVGIGLGERAYWSKGYGTDAMRLLLQYGFCEWNTHRIALSVFEYNTRAIRAYEKLGLKHEGRRRATLRRGGQRYDMLYMGVLRGEWERLKHG